MESLYLLVPLSVGLILAAMAVFAWALNGDQFDNLGAEGERLLFDDTRPGVSSPALDVDQAAKDTRTEE